MVMQTFVAHHADEVLLLCVSQHVLLQVLLLFESRVAAFVLALKRTLLAMHILNVNFQLGAGGEG